jgi:hypothetical protein
MKLPEIIRAAIEIGRQPGFVTFDELNELLPSATTEPEDIEDLMKALSDEGIHVRDDTADRSQGGQSEACPPFRASLQKDGGHGVRAPLPTLQTNDHF